MTPFIIKEILAPDNTSSTSEQITHSTNTETISETPTNTTQAKEVKNVIQASPVVEDVKISDEKAFDWDAFDASPERAKLGEDVIRMQNNNLKGAHFLPVNYGKSNLENL